MDVDQKLLGMVERREGIAIGRRLSEPRADGEHEVGLLDPLDQFGIRAIAEIAGIDRAVGRDRVLPAESGRDRKADTLGK